MCWNVHEESGKFTISSVARLSLPPSKHRWISAVTVLSDFDSGSAAASNSLPTTTIVCGDRKGSVHVYHCVLEDSIVDGPTTYQKPLQTLRLHGSMGVTSIVAHESYIYTAGRDGFCRKFSLGFDGLLTELSKFKVQRGVLVHCCILLMLLSFFPTASERDGLD